MKSGSTIEALAAKIIKEAQSKKDYAIDTRSLRFTDQGGLCFSLQGQERCLTPTSLCVDQIASRVGIPAKYAERLRTEAPELLAKNVNHWFTQKPEVRLLRTIQNGKQEARAFLSRKYRPLDNYDLLNAVLPRFEDAGLEIKSCELTETRLYIQAVTPRLEAKVKGDVVQAGILIRNSEIGCGSLAVEPLLYTLACTNGLVLPNSLRKSHIGRAGDGEWDSGEAFEVFSDETRQLDDKAFWAKVNDTVTHSLKEVNFNAAIKRLEDTTKIDTGAPAETIELIGDKFNLVETERNSILTHLAKGGDLSLYGLANAVTRTAQDAESYDRAVELERLGGQVIELPQAFFNN